MGDTNHQKIWVTYVASLVGTLFIVLGLGVLPLFLLNSGMVAFLGAALVFVSSTYQFLLSRQGEIQLN
jgi:hypothetical protein|tara:strand:- start:268 stop:471 length:204 start_codon:yes stop_codon:yes gene_type:complete